MNKYFSRIKLKEAMNGFASYSLKKKLILLTVIVLALLSIIVLISFGGRIFLAGNTTNKNETKPLEVSTKTACKLPTIEVKEHAFTIGVPKGWLYELNNGTVSIMKNKENLEGAFLYTAKSIKKDLTAKEFLTASSKFFTKAVAEDGGTFNVTNIVVSGNNSQGTIEASLNNTLITGLYRVEKNGDFFTMRAYYAPRTNIKESQANLEAIIGCFTRDTSISAEMLAATKKAQTAEATKLSTPSGFTKYTGKYFSLSLPTGYKVTGESDSGVDISRDDMSAGFSYAYVTGAKGPYDSRSWTLYALPKYASIQNLTLSVGKNISTEVPGMKIQEFAFAGILSGSTSVKGKVTTGVINTTDYGAGSSTSAFWAIQIAKPTVWNSVATKLQTIQDSVTIVDIGNTRKRTMLPPNRPMESTGSSITSTSSGASISDEVSENWAAAMRGYESAESPTTGDTYDVPLNSWDPTGPEGPGYYLNLPNGGQEKLK